MKRFSAALVVVLEVSAACLAGGSSGVAWAQTPQATELTDKPFFIKKTWTIGGEGNWDYMTLDPVALQLYIAHGSAVQVVDVNEGKLSGQVTGLRDAHGIALDDNGQYGYVTDGISNEVHVFDRQSLQIVATIPTGKNPRSVVFDQANRLVYVICPATSEESKIPRRTASGQTIRQSSDPLVKSTITVIDADTQKRLADLILPGKLGYGQTDGKGTVYVNVTDRNQIVYFHGQGIESRLRRLAAGPPSAPSADGSRSAGTADPTLTVDWSDTATEDQPVPKGLHVFPLTDCQSPKSLAIDAADNRIFAACDNMKMQVIDSTNGKVMDSLPIGAGTDGIGYDSTRGLIYSSNGGGVGSLTIIRQHLTDSYAVIQELPTRARARTLAVNSVSGDVYLVTNITGFDLTHKGGIGDLKTAPVEGSFQVLVVGN
jgi:YVTN family beta-propeller protein